ncbi:MAG: DUF3795 domain-containing protein [Deltaproteobacteria bacterium]|nr:DUF3795 domain-containing protein [Deltaproteobacteria bacterium]
MDYMKMTAPCGLDCFNCPVYMAGDNEDLRKKIAQNMGMPEEKVVCKGCRAENGTIPFLDMTEPCRVYQCIKKKNIDFCCNCTDFPCDYLHPYAEMAEQRPHNTKVFNLCLIKKMGLQPWAETKAKSVRDTYFKGKFKL